MECPRGSVCKETEHTVKTLKMAKEWLKWVDESMLPIKVNQLTAADGRVQITIRDKTGTIVHMRG